MPKMKTKKSASKRFKVRASGSIKRGHKRHLRGSTAVHAADVASVKSMLPFA